MSEMGDTSNFAANLGATFWRTKHEYTSFYLHIYLDNFPVKHNTGLHFILKVYICDSYQWKGHYLFAISAITPELRPKYP